MELVDQPLRLNYYTTAGEVVACGIVELEEMWYNGWLCHMAESNPEFIFFLTVASTDIWEKEPGPNHSCSCHARDRGPCVICKELGCEVWDFNQYALPIFS